MTMAGWGELWGLNWGDTGAPTVTFRILFVDTVQDNVVRVELSEPPIFSYLEDNLDASLPSWYTITPVAGSFGVDGLPARPVNVLFAAPALIADPSGHMIDLTVDRPFSPYPSQYTLTISNLTSALTNTTLDPMFNSYTFYGLRQNYLPADAQLLVPSTDFANPQTLDMLGDESGESTPSELGTYPVDNTGDYSTDSGLSNLKKRIFRRLMTVRGAFAHAPNYGIGIGEQMKRLNVPAIRDSLANEAEIQIGQEPDVVKVKVDVILDPTIPSLVRFNIRVKTIQGFAVKFDAPINFT